MGNNSGLHCITGMKRYLIVYSFMLISWSSYSQVFNYEIKDLEGQYECDWIGNSFPALDFVTGSKSSDNNAFGFEHMPFQMHTMFVSTDGTVFTNGQDSERSFHGIAIKDRNILVNYTKNAFNSGGYCVVADDTYVYLGQKDKSSGKYGVTRYNRSTGEYAGFPGGAGTDNALIEIGTQPSGITIFNNHLFVADPGESKMIVFDLANLSQTPVKKYSIQNPGPIVADKNGVIWVQDTENAKINAYQDGQKLPQEIILESKIEAMGMAVDNENRLMLCDRGIDMNVKIYGKLDSTPELMDEIGIKGGILSGETGKTGHMKLIYPGAVGVDAQNNIYILQNTFDGHEAPLLQVFSPDKTLLWETAGLEFVTVADVDPRDETMLISSNSIYKYDYDGDIGTSWTRESVLGTDETHSTSFIRYVDNKRLMFTLNTSGNDLKVYRLDNHRAEFYTTIENTRGVDIDHETGTVWPTHQSSPIEKYDLSGFTADGLPVWGASEKIQLPEPFNDVRRIMYDEENDDMYLVGYTDLYPYDEDFGSTEGYWKKAGRYIAKYSQWSADRTLEWGFHTPWCDGCDREVAQSVEEEGDFIFIVVGSKSKTSDLRRRPIIFIYRKSNGELVGTMQPGGNVNDRAMVDMTHSMNVYKRDNGEYIIIMEDCAYAKNIVFRWQPLRWDVQLMDFASDTLFTYDNISIEPEVIADTVSILKVELYANDQLMGTSTKSPYIFPVSDTSLGYTTLQVKLVASNGAYKWSNKQYVIISNGNPEVKITGPAADTTININDVIKLAANSTDYDGIVDSVEFYAGDELLGTTKTLPYEISWEFGDAGRYSIIAKAYDDSSRVGMSDTSEVTVYGYMEADLPGKTGEGLIYAYYEGSWQSLPDLSQQEIKKKDTVPNFDISCKLRNDQFAFFFSGYITIPEKGKYTFFTASDDGSQLYIDDRLIVDNDGIHGIQEKTGAILLDSGLHRIDVSMFEYLGSEELVVKYEGPDISKQPIPDEVLFRSLGSPPLVSIVNPEHDTVFNLRDPIRFKAAIYDEDSDVSKIEFYTGDYMLGYINDTSMVFEFKGLASGNHQIVAKAYDLGGAMALSDTLNIFINSAPKITINSPEDKTEYTTADTILILFSIEDVNLQKADLYLNGKLLNSFQNEPFSKEISSLAVGRQFIKITAIDSFGLETTEDIEIMITNSLPEISIINPDEGAVFEMGEEIIFKAAVTDLDNDVYKVAFYTLQGQLGGNANIFYETTVNNLSVGDYAITAKAFDKAGGIAESDSLHISVINPVFTHQNVTFGSTILYPNPAGFTDVRIQIEDAINSVYSKSGRKIRISVINSEGKMLYNRTLNDLSEEIRLEKEIFKKRGLYIIRIGDDGHYTTKKLVIQ